MGFRVFFLSRVFKSVGELIFRCFCILEEVIVRKNNVVLSLSLFFNLGVFRSLVEIRYSSLGLGGFYIRSYVRGF